MKLRHAAAFLLLLLLPAAAQPVRRNAAFTENSIARNDDGSSAITPLGFTINFFGKQRSSAFVNNNGNITFDQSLPTFTPFGLRQTNREIIAPFFADVDTRPGKSRLVTFGQDVIGGRKVFGVNYIEVGYYNTHDDKLNTFQLVVIDRSDTGAGNFDIEFNYERIAWETGDASGGTGGFGGVPAVVGWSNGTADDGTSFELAGSMISGEFLDNGPRALIRTKLNNTVVGRLVFRARDGVLSPGLTIQTGPALTDGVAGQRYSYRLEGTGVQGPVRWELLPDVTLPPGLSLSGDTLTGTPTAPGIYGMTVSMSATVDGEALTVYRRTALVIRSPRLFISTVCPLPDGTAGRNYTATLRAGGAASAVAWSTDRLSLPPGLTLTPAGVLTGTPATPGAYDFLLRAETSDAFGTEPAEMSCKLTVVPASIRLSQGCVLPDATVGVPYQQELVAEGGVGPYRFEMSGQLPTGVALSPSGRISGIPTVAAGFPFQVSITDSRGQKLAGNCALQVNEPAVAITSNCPLPSAVTSQEYRASLSAKAGDPPYTWEIAGTLPSGLTLNPAGAITGRPAAAGAFLFRLITTDAAGRQSGQPCSLAVARGPLSIGNCPLPDATAGVPYQTQLTAIGGIEPYSWTATGQTPPGLTITRGGLMSGNAQAPGTYALGFELRDGDGRSATQTCSIRVNAPPLRLATSCPLPGAVVGRRYTAKLSAAGGTAPYSFRTRGVLPQGISAAQDGSFTGTPDSIGSTTFSVEVGDAAGTAVESLCSMDVGLPPLPAIRIAPLPATIAAANASVRVGVELSEAYSLPVTGQASLAVTPEAKSLDAVANQADPRLRFQNGQLSVPFTIRPGATSAEIPLLSTGTVASAVTVSLSNLKAGGVAVSAPVIPRVFRVPAAPPNIASACFTVSTSAMEITLLGSSTTRELTSAEVVVGSNTLRTDITNIAASYFGAEETIRSGGAFSLRIPVREELPRNTTSVSVRLSNSSGWSATTTAQRCQ